MQVPSFNISSTPTFQAGVGAVGCQAKPNRSQASSPLQVHKSWNASVQPLLAVPSGNPRAIKKADSPRPTPFHISNSTFTVSEIWHGQNLHFLRNTESSPMTLNSWKPVLSLIHCSCWPGSLACAGLPSELSRAF